MMKSFKRWFQLTGEDRGLLVSSLLLQASIRVGLWLVPFSNVQRLTVRWADRKGVAGVGRAERVIWAIAATSRLVPRCTCFVRALAAQVLLQRCGCETALRVGVAKKRNGQLKGHAWLERNGEVVVGEMEDLSQYTLLPLWKQRSREDGLDV
jgi:transglutaminase superfamily protein